MAPKKKQQQPKKPNSKAQPASSNNSKPQTSSSGPRLQISAENENRLRRLLLNSGRSAAVPVDESLSKAQKAKKLKAVYEKLSCEGFTNDQIELALSAVKVNINLHFQFQEPKK
jgi:ATP-dependent RNA helicase DHX29